MGKLSFDRGRRFENFVRTKLAIAGFRAVRTNEYDYSQGVDIVLLNEKGKAYPVAIQCKASQRSSDLLAGLSQARSGWPTAILHICVQRLYVGKVPQRTLRIAASYKRRPNSVYTDLSWIGLVKMIEGVVSG